MHAEVFKDVGKHLHLKHAAHMCVCACVRAQFCITHVETEGFISMNSAMNLIPGNLAVAKADEAVGLLLKCTLIEIVTHWPIYIHALH